MFIVKLFKLFNKLYKHCYPIYKPFYYLYKHISDRKKIVMIKKYIEPGMVALDIGANIGFYTVLLSKLVGKKGKVYAFEPEKINFERLTRNVKKCDNVVVEKAAVGEKNKKIKLFISDSLNVDHRTFSTFNNRPYYEVECISIDNYIKSEEKIGFIKLDIQGYDYFALLGMRETIKNSDKLFFIGEYWPWGLKESGASHNKYLDELATLGINYAFFNKDVESIEGAENDENKYFDLYGYKNNKKNYA